MRFNTFSTTLLLHYSNLSAHSSCEPANARRAVLFFDEVIKFEIDPTPETYKTLAAIFKAAKEEKVCVFLFFLFVDPSPYTINLLIAYDENSSFFSFF